MRRCMRHNLKGDENMKYLEPIFDLVYLVFTIVAAFVFFIQADGHEVYYLYGLASLVLGLGDAFHLVPRIIGTFRPKLEELDMWLGLGTFISSITMTIFDIFLLYIWIARFPWIEMNHTIFLLIWLFAVVRIGLCLAPSNNWFRKEGNPQWAIYRNIPLVLIGVCFVYLFYIAQDWSVIVAILISFACYIPVVLFSKTYPKVGMLMIPKTLAYVYIIAQGLILM